MLTAFAACSGTAGAAVDTLTYVDLFDVVQHDLTGANKQYITSGYQYSTDDQALSPAGDKVVYADGNWNIGLSMGGSDYLLYQSQYNTYAHWADNPQWHPDEQSVIFSRSAGAATKSWDISTLRVYENTPVSDLIAWPGNQYEPVYSSDGLKIAFSSSHTPSGTALKAESIYVASANGSAATLIVAGSEPTFSPDGTRIAYRSGGNLYAVNASDGRNKVQLTRDGQSGDPDWSTDGTTVAYRKGVPTTDNRIFYEIWMVGANGTNNRAHVSEPGKSKFSPSYRQSSRTVGFNDYLAGVYWPDVRFDSSEQWRPLHVERFFQEGGHTVNGTPMFSSGPMRDFPFESATIDVRGDGEEENYTTNDPSCAGNGLRDCDSGSSTSYYYNVSNPSPGGYRYLDYWFFYRYNYFAETEAAGNHEADWEGVSIAPSLGNVNTFDFASFSQHGTWYSYLRSVLACDGGAPGSCGTEAAHAGTRVHVYPANGSHANYAETCREILWYDCTQENGLPERGHDGNVQSGTYQITRFPAKVGWSNPSNASWTDWPGAWGTHRSVRSPGAAGTGNGAHFDAPWRSTCSLGDAGCAHEAGYASRTRLPSRQGATGGLKACGSWFGGDVAALACAPSRLGRALDGAKLRGGGTLAVEGEGLVAGTAPGLAQALGGPLRAGQRLRVRGTSDGRSVLFVRGQDARRTVAVRFTLPAGAADGTVTASEAAGRVKLRLQLAGGRLVAPDAISAKAKPAAMRGRAPRVRKASGTVPTRRVPPRPLVGAGKRPAASKIPPARRAK